MKKFLALLLALLMAATLFVGCAKEETGTEKTDTEKSDTTDTADEVVEGDQRYAGVKLIYWDGTNEGTADYDATVANIEKWEAMTGAEVEYHAYGADLNTLLPTTLEAGEPLDVYTLGSVIQASSNLQYSLDITEYVEATDMIERGYPVFWDQIRNWIEGADGRIYGVPTTPSFTSFWYNKAAFDAAGIEGTPATIEEFEDACDKLIAAGYHPIALDSAYAMSYFGVHIQAYVGEETVEDLVVNGGWAENEDAVRAFQKIIDWVDAGYFDPNSPSEWPASQNMIGLDESNAMVYSGIWIPGEVEEMTGADLDWGCFLYPAVTDGKGVYGTSLSNGVMTINKNCENPDAAFDFIYFMKTGEPDQLYSDAARYIPCDSTNTPLSDFDGAMELLSSVEAPINYAGGLLANPDIKTSVTDTIIQLYSGEFADGMEAAQAFDALVQ